MESLYLRNYNTMPPVILFGRGRRKGEKGKGQQMKAVVVDSLGSYGGGMSKQLCCQLRDKGVRVCFKATDEQWSNECGYVALWRARKLQEDPDADLPPSHDFPWPGKSSDLGGYSRKSPPPFSLAWKIVRFGGDTRVRAPPHFFGKKRRNFKQGGGGL